MSNNCMICGDRMKGRQDKKFCSAACKNEFHNGNPARRHPWRKRVLEAINRNYRILSELDLKGVHCIAEKDLEYSGFTLMGITGVEPAGKGRQRYYCYEYELNPDGQNLLIRNMDKIREIRN